MIFKKKKIPNIILLELDDRSVEIAIKPHKRAKNYKLSIPAGKAPTLSMPYYGNMREAERFLLRHKDWLQNKLKSNPKPVKFCDGAIIPLRGVNHRLIMLDSLRAGVQLVGNGEMPIIKVGGGEHHMARRLTDWLKKQAKIDIEKSLKYHCDNLNVTYKSISIRSQSSRWGSCSSAKRLNFNWRLIMAPPFVLDYVVAHEAAHLIEMNHSQKFWDLVRKTLPDMQRGKKWLKQNGQYLMLYNA